MHQIKVSDRTYELIKKICEERGISQSNLIDELVSLYLGGMREGKIIKNIISKEIDVLWEVKCASCGKVLKPGDKARYTAYIYEDGSKSAQVRCLDCYISADPVLWRKYVKIKEYEAIIKQLRAESDRLVEEIRTNQVWLDIVKIKREVLNLWNTASFVLRNYDPELLSKYEEILNKMDEILSRLSELEGSVKVVLNMVRKKEKIVSEAQKKE